MHEDLNFGIIYKISLGNVSNLSYCVLLVVSHQKTIKTIGVNVSFNKQVYTLKKSSTKLAVTTKAESMTGIL